MGLIEPRFGDGHYPIGRLVLQRVARLGLSRTEFVRRCGYINDTNGHRALTKLLQTGVADPKIGQKMAAALELPADLVAVVLDATAQQRAVEAALEAETQELAYHRNFRPFLRATTERRVPEPIFVAVLASAAWRTVAVPENLLSLDEPTRDALVRDTVLGHYREHRGQIPAFGAITGYDLIVGAGRFVDFGLPYDVAGTRAGPLRELPRLRTGALQIKGKTLPPHWIARRRWRP